MESEHEHALQGLELVNQLMISGGDDACDKNRLVDLPPRVAVPAVKMGVFATLESVCRLTWHAGGAALSVRALTFVAWISLRLSTCPEAIRADVTGCASLISTTRKVVMCLLESWEAQRGVPLLSTAFLLSTAMAACAAELVQRTPAPPLPTLPPDSHCFGIYAPMQARRVAAILDLPATEMTAGRTPPAGPSPMAAAAALMATLAAMRTLGAAVLQPQVKEASPCVLLCHDPSCTEDDTLGSHDGVSRCLEMSTHLLAVALRSSPAMLPLLDVAQVPTTWHSLFDAALQHCPDIGDQNGLFMEWHGATLMALPAVCALTVRCQRWPEAKAALFAAEPKLVPDVGRLINRWLVLSREENTWLKGYGLTEAEMRQLGKDEVMREKNTSATRFAVGALAAIAMAGAASAGASPCATAAAAAASALATTTGLASVSGDPLPPRPVSAGGTAVAGTGGTSAAASAAAAAAAAPTTATGRLSVFMFETMGGPDGHLGCWSMGCTNLAGPSERTLRCQVCSGCKVARYCSPACQRGDWGKHKGPCKAGAAAVAAAAAAVAAAARPVAVHAG